MTTLGVAPHVEASHVALMRDIATRLAVYSREALRAYPALLRQYRQDARVPRIMPVVELFGRLRAAYSREFDAREPETMRFLERIEAAARTTNLARWVASIRAKSEASSATTAAKQWAISQEPNIPLAVSERWKAQQLDLIKKFGTSRVPPIPAQHFAELEKLVQNAVHNGLRVEELRSQITGLDGVTARRAEVIARDQVNKYNGKMTQLRHESIGIKAYFWRTSGDGRVRPKHKERDGKRFLYSKPPADGAPGEPVQCRCWADPDLDAALSSIEKVS